MRLNSLDAKNAKEAMLCTAERTIFLTVGTTREYQGEIKEIKTYDRPTGRTTYRDAINSAEKERAVVVLRNVRKKKFDFLESWNNSQFFRQLF